LKYLDFELFLNQNVAGSEAGKFVSEVLVTC